VFASPNQGHVSFFGITLPARRAEKRVWFGFESLQHLNRKENRVMLKFGNKVVHPHQGPCLIGEVVKKVVGGRPTSFYPLALLDGSGGELFIPVDKIRGLGIRQLMAKSEIPKLLGLLRKPAAAPTNWKQRAIDNFKLLTSGSAFDLAEVVESLTELNETRALSPRDRQTLDRARRVLICEISEVTGATKGAAEERVDHALSVRKKHEAAGRKKAELGS
jgi:CarD family transcriptional regulator